MDVFFVISGYLITRIILSELQDSGSFSFSTFYERRARRILPMLFAVILASIPFAWHGLLPIDFVAFSKSVLTSIFFGSNFFFYLSATEYGADSALLKPFLHTWSLGVEEQFYLLFPLLAIAAYRYFRRYFLWIVVFLSVLSLMFAQVMEVRDPDMNFYLPFSRFWELAVGAILAYRELYFKTEKSYFLGLLMPVLGVFLIAASVLFFDGKTPHPGFYTIIPIIGVALVIGFATVDVGVGRLLGSRSLVGVGLISYSAYLWHFPIFAFARMGGNVEGNYDKLLLIFSTFLLSVVSYFFIEKPFRNRFSMPIKRLIGILGVVGGGIVVFMFYSIYSGGLWSRYSVPEQEMLKGMVYYEYKALKHPEGKKGELFLTHGLSDGCNMRNPEDACRYGNEKIVFLGDSYVGHLERAFVDRIRPLKLGFISFNYEQCPFVGDDLWFFRAECSVVNELRRDIIKNFKDRKIFIVSANEGQFLAAKRRTDDPIGDGLKRRSDGDLVDPSIVWESYFNSIRWLVESGHKVVVVGTIPPTWLNGNKWLGDNVKYLASMDFPNVYNPSSPSALNAQDDSRYPIFDSDSILMIRPSDIMCDSASDHCLDVKENYGPLYSGGGRHLSYLGAALIADSVIDSLLKNGWIEN